MTRDLTKTATFAALHFVVGFAVTYAFTGSVAVATGVALVEPAINTVVFFFHERAWRATDMADGRGTGTVTLGGHAHGFKAYTREARTGRGTPRGMRFGIQVSK